MGLGAAKRRSGPRSLANRGLAMDRRFGRPAIHGLLATASRAMLRAEVAVTNADDEILARNDLYLRTVVEAYHVCPWARTCREQGKLHREIVHGEDPAAALRDRLAHLQQSGDDGFEVALVILPEFAAGPQAFERLARRLETEVAAELAAQGRAPACHLVAFHPELNFGTDAPHRLVGLLRRSPDPTLQLVRRSVLDRVRGQEPPDEVVVDEGAPQEVLARLAQEPPHVGVSERVARANLATWQRQGPDLTQAIEDAGRPGKP